MIIPITILVAAFLWLGYETDWMRVRLMVGDYPIPELEYVDWLSCFDSLAWDKLTYRADIDPICGWNWIKGRLHPLPVYKIELYYGNGYRQKITLKNPNGNILKQVIKINTGKKYFRRLMEMGV